MSSHHKLTDVAIGATFLGLLLAATNGNWSDGLIAGAILAFALVVAVVLMYQQVHDRRH